MGVFQFVKDAGRKLTDRVRGESAPTAPAAPAASAQASGPSPQERDQRIARLLQAKVAGMDLGIQDLEVHFKDGNAVLTGRAESSGDAERAVLIVGNSVGVAQVDDKIEVAEPAPQAVFHTVVRGDTLSKIAQEHYGVMRLYETVFGANVPMLEHPDAIYPGQVLRIPAVGAPLHIVKPGESLSKIAKYWYGKSSEHPRIAAANGLDTGAGLQVGQEIRIPLAEAAPAVS
jgi:nucleoid-associated protein YgaU